MKISKNIKKMFHMILLGASLLSNPCYAYTNNIDYLFTDEGDVWTTIQGQPSYCIKNWTVGDLKHKDEKLIMMVSFNSDTNLGLVAYTNEEPIQLEQQIIMEDGTYINLYYVDFSYVGDIYLKDNMGEVLKNIRAY